jgi:S1-C subfamily serine protease
MRPRFYWLACVSVIVFGSVGCAQHAPKVPIVPTPTLSYEALLSHTRKAIVAISATSPGLQALSQGTGFIVSPNGDILTCNHVVTKVASNAMTYYDTLQVTMPDGSKVNARVTGGLTQNRVLRDYALLKVDLKTPNFLEIADISDVNIGDDLLAWGFPFGLPGPVLIKASVATTLKETVGTTDVQAIVFQGPNNKGMSGGPVILNRTGRVVGITSNRIAGIGKELDETRQFIRSTAGNGSVTIMGVNPNAAILALTETLDKFLMSGMGVAITVDHVRAELALAAR